MTEIEVIEIANEIYGKNTPWHGVQRQRLMLLAERLTAVEREACAKFVEDGYVRQFEQPWREDLAAAIRARGQT